MAPMLLQPVRADQFLGEADDPLGWLAHQMRRWLQGRKGARDVRQFHPEWGNM